MLQQQSQPSQQSTTLAQKTDIVAGLALFPALTLMVFMRRKIGYRFLSVNKLFAAFVVIWIVAGLSGLQSAGIGMSAGQDAYTFLHQAPLFIFAIAMFVTGIVKRYLRFKDIKHGVSWHTYSRGVSWFASVLPMQDSNIRRYVDPAIAFVAGLLLSFPFGWLGYWIMFSAFCLFVFESWDYEQQLNRMLDVLDSLVDSEVVGENVAYYSQEQPQQRPLEETAGIPTGIAPDIEAQIQKRRNRRSRPVQTQTFTPQWGQSQTAQPVNQQAQQNWQVPFPNNQP